MVHDALQSLILDHFQVNFFERNRLRNDTRQNKEKIIRLQEQKYQFLQVFLILWVGFYKYPLEKDHKLWFYKFWCDGSSYCFGPTLFHNEYIDTYYNNAQNQQ